MKIGIVLPNHNQNKYIKETLGKLKTQTTQPDTIFICSDDKPFNTKQKNVVCINNKELKGRCQNRNSVIPYFLESQLDAIIFIDGDSYPKESDFIEKYEEYFETYDLIFGTREHSSIKGIKVPPSDLLTANMDELWQKKKLNYQDLRVVSKALESWQSAESFDEKLDLMVTGMIGWSCNFGFTRKGFINFLTFMEDNYGRKEIFDSRAFNGNWGYEDVAMGIDALYAGLNIWISDDIKIVHRAHERTDGLFDHVKGRHLIMDRYRNLEKLKKSKDKFYFLMMGLFGFYIIGIITGLFTGFLTFVE